MLASYHAMTASRPNVIFGGRLGSYKYLDMHQAIGAALKTFEHEVEPSSCAETCAPAAPPRAATPCRLCRRDLILPARAANHTTIARGPR
ncbi:hypothetical protein ACVIHD_006599 [Bradyrhizobium embrapense]